MILIKGKKVVLHQRIENGVDEFNYPTFDIVDVEVDNVLVEPASSDEVINEHKLSGRKLAYVLHIPRDDEHDWINASVTLPSPWNVTVETYGDYSITDYDLTPMDWGKKIKAEIYE